MSNAKNKIDEKDILEFFKYSYFGNLKDPIEAASNRAYRDMCRTLDFKDIDENDKKNFKEEVKAILKNIIKNEDKNQNINNIKNQDEFDTWHHGLCDNIIEKCKKIEKYKKTDNDKKEKIQLTYGQAQKWVNMTIKYLYILNDHTFDNVFDFLHIPVDNYILDIANKNFRIDKPKKPWSKWDEEQYRNYQNEIKLKIKIAPLLWEFDNWLKVAKGNNKK